MLLQGIVHEQGDAEQKPLDNATIALFDITENDKQLVAEMKNLVSTGYEFTLTPNRKYELKASCAEHFSTYKKFNTVGLESSATMHESIGLTRIEQNKSYRLDNIYYEYASAKLTDASKVVLDSLHRLLTENPKIIIELGAHTDSKGSADYNQKLSQKRAESCVDYLLEKEIPSERLIPKGYGESEAVASNECIDGSDNPDGRAQNRRTEFKIIGDVKNIKIIRQKL